MLSPYWSLSSFTSLVGPIRDWRRHGGVIRDAFVPTSFFFFASVESFPPLLVRLIRDDEEETKYA